MGAPDVTVIVGVYDAMPYLTRCIESVTRQSLGRHRVELVAVDDGSTDGSGAELDRLAAAYPGILRVVHQENSGGPAAPRNRGLDLATGRYVFFLDADDYLGIEALERMVAMADANGSDVVLGKMVGVGGREAPRSMFRGDQPSVDLFSSRVYWTLSPLKLFRRSLLERLGLRFRTDLSIGEDQPFVASAYLGASVISVVGDYDCYYWVRREDNGNVTVRTRGTHKRLLFTRAMFELITERVRPGPGRDLLLTRHFDIEVKRALGHLAAETEPELATSAFAQIRELTDRWYSEEIAARLPALTRLSLHVVRRGSLERLLEVVRFAQSNRRGKTITDKGRVFGAYPFFRDLAFPIPDEHFDITEQLGIRHRLDSVTLTGTQLKIEGYAFIHRLDTRDTSTELVLRERGGTTELRLSTVPLETRWLTEELGERCYDYGGAGFSAVVDLATVAKGAPLPEGLWDLFIRLETQGVEKWARIGCERGPGVDAQPRTRVVRLGAHTGYALTTYYTKPYGNLSVDIGENKHRVAPLLTVSSMAWDEGVPGTLTIVGKAPEALPPAALLVRLGRDLDRGSAQEREKRQRHLVPCQTTASGAFTARVPLARVTSERPLSSGSWAVELELSVGDLSWVVPVPGRLGPCPARWRRRGLPVYARTLSRDGALVLRTGTVNPVAAVRRRCWALGRGGRPKS